MKRTRLKPRSAKKILSDEAKPEVREAVFHRDDYRCIITNNREAGGAMFGASGAACFGPITPHHLRKDGQGGDYVVGNLVTLCAHHNDLVESRSPAAAWAYGLVCRRGDVLDDCWRKMRTNGLVAW